MCEEMRFHVGKNEGVTDDTHLRVCDIFLLLLFVLFLHILRLLTTRNCNSLPSLCILYEGDCVLYHRVYHPILLREWVEGTYSG